MLKIEPFLTLNFHTNAKLNCLKQNCFWLWNCSYTKLNLTVSKQKTIHTLNWIVLNKTVWLNWIAWNRKVFDYWNVYLCQIELFKIELFICIKMDLASNNLQRLICLKTQTSIQINRNEIKFELISARNIL